MCDELKDWIGEKTNGINLDDVGKDLASVRLLQRKQQNLEQELKPIEEKLNKMNMMANAYVFSLLTDTSTTTTTTTSQLGWGVSDPRNMPHVLPCRIWLLKVETYGQ